MTDGLGERRRRQRGIESPSQEGQQESGHEAASKRVNPVALRVNPVRSVLTQRRGWAVARMAARMARDRHRSNSRPKIGSQSSEGLVTSWASTWATCSHLSGEKNQAMATGRALKVARLTGGALRTYRRCVAR